MELEEATKIIQEVFQDTTTQVRKENWSYGDHPSTASLTGTKRVSFAVVVFTKNNKKDCRSYGGENLKELVERVIHTELPFYSGEDRDTTKMENT